MLSGTKIQKKQNSFASNMISTWWPGRVCVVFVNHGYGLSIIWLTRRLWSTKTCMLTHQHTAWRCAAGKNYNTALRDPKQVVRTIESTIILTYYVPLSDDKQFSFFLTLVPFKNSKSLSKINGANILKLVKKICHECQSLRHTTVLYCIIHKAGFLDLYNPMYICVLSVSRA